MKKKYDTAIIIAYALGLEKQLVPKEVRQGIPNTTSAYWTHKINPKKYIGNHLANDIYKNLADAQLLLQVENKRIKKISIAICRLQIVLLNILDPKIVLLAFKNNKEYLVKHIEHIAENIELKTVLKFLNIKYKTYCHWRAFIHKTCHLSPIKACLKRNPNQATVQEVKTIEKMLTEEKTKHWSIHNIWAFAFRKQKTALSESSWNHYNRIFKFRKNWKKVNKPPYKSIVAYAVHQIWQADITIYKTLDGVKHYIYTVMDTYSRYILEWQLHHCVAADMRLQTIKDAILNYIPKQYNKTIQLITDGGSENDNHTIKDFLRTAAIDVKHDIALKDIVQSNSNMEAFYRTAKYRYLYTQPIANREQLLEVLNNMFEEYNNIKPHHALNIFTPLEVLNGKQINIDLKPHYNQAAIDRRKFNKNNHCTVC